MDTSADDSITTDKTRQNKLKNSIFKRSDVNKKDTFRVSLNNSNSPTLSSSITATRKKNPFLRNKRKNNENLSVSACDSINESESEKTCFTLKSKNLFGKKVENSDNQFNVFFEDTTIVQSNSQNLENKTLEEVNSLNETRLHPFQAGEKTQKHLFNIEFDETGNNEPSEEISQRLSVFQKVSLNNQNFTVVYNDSLTQSTQNFENTNESHIQRKKNLFSKNTDVPTNDVFNDSKTNNGSEKINNVDSINSFDISYATPTCNKENFEKPSVSLQSLHEATRAVRQRQDSNSVSENDFNNLSNREKRRSNRASIVSLSKNISKNNSSISSDVCNMQSSYNDDNLDNWMSAESDAEISVPEVSSIQSNFLADKETSRVTETVTVQGISNSLIWEHKFNDIVSNASKNKQYKEFDDTIQILSNKKKSAEKPCSTTKKLQQQRLYNPTKLKKPAPYANKRFYQYIINKIKPKFGIDSYVKAEEIVFSICETVKIVTRKKDHQKKLIDNLKKEMAKAGLIETTNEFNEFVIKFLPYNFRVKVVPCLQPLTNTIYPPRDTINPFDKIF